MTREADPHQVLGFLGLVLLSHSWRDNPGGDGLTPMVEDSEHRLVLLSSPFLEMGVSDGLVFVARRSY
jgi:hypothetical protein